MWGVPAMWGVPSYLLFYIKYRIHVHSIYPVIFPYCTSLYFRMYFSDQHENIRISPGETTCASCTTGKIWCHRMSVAMLKKHLAPSHLPCRTWRADPTVAATLPATSPAKIPGAGPWGQTVVCLPVCIWVGDADNSCSRDVVVCIHYLPRMSSRQWHE